MTFTAAERQQRRRDRIKTDEQMVFARRKEDRERKAALVDDGEPEDDATVEYLVKLAFARFEKPTETYIL